MHHLMIQKSVDKSIQTVLKTEILSFFLVQKHKNSAKRD